MAKATRLAAWRQRQMQELTLPSGLKVKLRKITMTDMMLTGKLPNSIVHLADAASKNGARALDLEAVAKNAAEFTELLDLLVRQALVEPALGETADDEHVTLAEISSDDKMAIFEFLNGGAGESRPFREGEDEPAADAPRGRRRLADPGEEPKVIGG